MSKGNYKDAQRREYFRIVYPSSECPRLLIDGLAYDVIDVSERGIRFDNGGSDNLFEIDQVVRGRIIFRDDQVCSVEGKVLRNFDGATVILLTRGIPPRLLMHEQRRLIRIYKHLV